MLRKANLHCLVCVPLGGEGCTEHYNRQLMCSVRSCTGVADHHVFVFNVMQPPPAFKSCHLEVSEDRLRLSKLSPGEAKGPRLVCRNPKPKICQSWLGVLLVMFRRWSVVKLGLYICFFLLTCCQCLLRCCCESITCFLLHSHWWRYKVPEGINSLVSFIFRLSSNTTNIAMLNKQPHQQGNTCRHSRPERFTPFCLRLIVSKNCTKWFTNNILLRNK